MRRLACMYAAILLLLLQSYQSFAQERTISGRITSNDNVPLVGVTITNTSTNKKATTNQAGEFRIQAQKGQKLSFTYVGYETQTVTVGDGAVVNVKLNDQAGELEEVTVAMDLKRNPKELGYSTQKVAGSEIQSTQRENFLNSLQGRVAGLTINTTSGTPGASSSIVLRGFNSLSLSNQPLFVIDGVIVDNSTIDENSNGGSGVGMVERVGLTGTANRNTDYNNRISDINPSDIESITVLKGPEATALYGSQAASGAIIITTRKAKSNKLAIQYDNSFRIQKVTRFPKMFDGFSNGINGDTSSIFRYFGPAYGPGTVLYNNKENLFETGFAQTHNLGADFGFKKSIFRFSASLFDQQGIVPNNTYKRINLRLSNTTKIGKYIDVTPSVTYIRTENNKVLRSAGGFMLGLLSFPTTIDMDATKGDNATKTPLFGTSATPNAEFDNPLFNVLRNKSREETDRLNASLGVNINPTKWLSLAGRFGFETYATDGYLRYHPLSYYITAATGGLQDNFYRRYEGYNHTITATARKTIAKDFNVRVMAGTMWQDYETRMFAVSGNGLIDNITNGKMYKNGVEVTDANFDQIVGSPSDSNATKLASRTRLLRNQNGEFNQSILRQFAYFGEFAINWKSKIFFSYTHRFEQASTLPKQNRNFNYPGMSVSAILTDIIPQLKGNLVSYWKLRTSLAQTAKLNSPYSTQSVFVNNLTAGGGYSYGFFNNNADLKPEKQKTYEVGTEIKLFKNRLGLDFTYYNTLNKGQIIENFRLSYGTGYVLNTQNAGSTRNTGIEISIDADVVKKRDITWNMRFNFAKQRSRVVELPKNVSLYYLADNNVYGAIAGGIVLGGSTTTISGWGYARNKDGAILVNPTTGLPVIDGNQSVRGDRAPDFTLGWNNSITYKNFKLTFLWDLKVGGDVWNGNNQYLTTIGRSYLTADRMQPRIIKGVLQDGLENTATPTINTISVTPYYQDLYYRNMPEEEFIEKDINWFKLRDITLNYAFSPSVYKRALKSMKGLSVFVTATDVFIFTNYSGADPSVNSNTAGTRGVGAFGLDYGTLPSQLGINFGLRASF